MNIIVHKLSFNVWLKLLHQSIFWYLPGLKPGSLTFLLNDLTALLKSGSKVTHGMSRPTSFLKRLYFYFYLQFFPFLSRRIYLESLDTIVNEILYELKTFTFKGIIDLGFFVPNSPFFFFYRSLVSTFKAFLYHQHHSVHLLLIRSQYLLQFFLPVNIPLYPRTS